MTNDIDEMERYAGPLIGAVALVLLALVLLALILDGLVTHYQNKATVEAFLQCMNGHIIASGDTAIRCEVRTLVAGIE